MGPIHKSMLPRPILVLCCNIFLRSTKIICFFLKKKYFNKHHSNTCILCTKFSMTAKLCNMTPVFYPEPKNCREILISMNKGKPSMYKYQFCLSAQFAIHKRKVNIISKSLLEDINIWVIFSFEVRITSICPYHIFLHGTLDIPPECFLLLCRHRLPNGNSFNIKGRKFDMSLAQDMTRNVSFQTDSKKNALTRQ